MFFKPKNYGIKEIESLSGFLQIETLKGLLMRFMGLIETQNRN